MRSTGGLSNTAESIAAQAIHDAATNSKPSPREKLNGKRTKGAKSVRGAVKGPKGDKSATGRKDATGQDKVIEMAVLKKNLPDLGVLHTKMKAASTAFREKVKGVAEKAGLLASTVRAVVVAQAGGVDVVAEKKREAEQLSLSFDELFPTA